MINPKTAYLFDVHSEGSSRLAFRTRSNPDLGMRVLEKGPKNGSTFNAVVLYLLQLRKDPGASGDDP